jgi:GH24 family phage-related lysozyme (muramidase)
MVKPTLVIGFPIISKLIRGYTVELEDAYLMPDSQLLNESRNTDCCIMDANATSLKHLLEGPLHESGPSVAYGGRKPNIISQGGIDLIKSFEGFSERVYDDAGGNPTIGYGHKLTDEDGSLSVVTQDQAEELLRKDVKIAEDAVNELVKVSLNQNQFDALVSWTYNLGKGALKSSTLLKVLNAGIFNEAGDYARIISEIKRWDKCKGEVLEGLVKRREAEAKLWIGDLP